MDMLRILNMTIDGTKVKLFLVLTIIFLSANGLNSETISNDENKELLTKILEEKLNLIRMINLLRAYNLNKNSDSIGKSLLYSNVAKSPTENDQMDYSNDYNEQENTNAKYFSHQPSDLNSKLNDQSIILKKLSPSNDLNKRLFFYKYLFYI